MLDVQIERASSSIVPDDSGFVAESLPRKDFGFARFDQLRASQVIRLFVRFFSEETSCPIPLRE